MELKYNRAKLKKVGLFALVVTSVLLGVFLTFRIALFLLPFLLAFALSSLMEPLIRLLGKSLRLKRKIAAPIVLLLFLAVLGLLLALVISRLVDEIKLLVIAAPAFLQELYVQITNLVNQARTTYEWLPADVTANLGGVISNLSGTVTNFGKSIVGGAIATAISLPEVLIFTIITLLATYFMASDREKIGGYIKSQLPETWLSRLKGIRNDMFSALFGYLRAALIMCSITFTELFIGFNLMHIRYSLLLAVLVAIIDALPILGTGSVLIPWGVYSLVTNDIRMGVSILVLYLVVLAVRQMVEPKVLGHQIGVYPLLTLMAMYTGLQLIGFAGLILGPITFLLIKNILGGIYKNKAFRDVIGFGSSREEP